MASSEQNDKASSWGRIAVAVVVAVVAGGVSLDGITQMPPSDLVGSFWEDAVGTVLVLGASIGSLLWIGGAFERISGRAKSVGYPLVGALCTLASLALGIWLLMAFNRVDQKESPRRCVGQASAVRTTLKGRRRLPVVCPGEEEFVVPVSYLLERVKPGDKVEVTWREGRLWRWGTVKPLSAVAPR